MCIVYRDQSYSIHKHLTCLIFFTPRLKIDYIMVPLYSLTSPSKIMYLKKILRKASTEYSGRQFGLYFVDYSMHIIILKIIIIIQFFIPVELFQECHVTVVLQVVTGYSEGEHNVLRLLV